MSHTIITHSYPISQMLEVIRLKSHPYSLLLSPPTNPNPLETLPSWISNAADGNPAQTAICVVATNSALISCFHLRKGLKPNKRDWNFPKNKNLDLDLNSNLNLNGFCGFLFFIFNHLYNFFCDIYTYIYSINDDGIYF